MAGPTPAPSPTPQMGVNDVMAMAPSSNVSSGAHSTSGKPDAAFGGFQYGPLGGGRGAAREPGEGTRQSQTPILKTVQQMINEYYGWSDKEKGNLRAKLGLIDKSALTATDDQIASLWGNYVQQSANYYAAGVSLTPWDILGKDITTRGGIASLAGTKTQKTSDTSLTSRIDSDALFTTAAQQLLGRDPTAQEKASFHAVLNAKEKVNPTISTTTTTTNDQGEVVNQSRTSSGGLGAGGAQLLAKEKAESNPEYGAYQAATTYYNAMMQVIQRGY